MKLRNPTQPQWIGLLSSILIILSGVFGWDKFGSTVSTPTTSNTTNVVQATHAHRSEESIKRMIDEAVTAYKIHHEQGGEFHE